MPEKRLPVWEVYNGQIAEMRRQGYTLQNIGDTVGVTRERVRQILEEYYGGTKTNLLPESTVAKIIGCPVSRLQKLRKEGVISPIKHGKWLWLYDRNEIERAMLALQKNCPHCGKPLPMKNRGRYCPECKRESRRNPFPFRSEAGRRKFFEATANWQKQHPERYAEILGKAMRKYCEKKKRDHFAKTKYVVVSGEAMPIGSVVKAIGCKSNHLVLENGIRIPMKNIRKIKKGATNDQ